MKTLLLTLTIAITLIACGPDANTVLYNQVMDIHDEVMPKMETLYNKRKELTAHLKTDSASITAEERTALEVRIAKIESAEKAMEDWMHDFNPPDKDADKDKTKAYLEDQLEKVKKVRDEMLTALE